MYERFTDRARKVMQLANQEAQRFNHEYIGTEHILLGLIREKGVASEVLATVGLGAIHANVEKFMQQGPALVTMGKLPQTPRAKKVVEYALEEASNIKHTYIGTEHILLGLLREEEGIAAQVLMNLGLTLEKARQKVLDLLTGPEPVRQFVAIIHVGGVLMETKLLTGDERVSEIVAQVQAHGEGATFMISQLT